jgi:hypothetical protein
VSSGFGGCLGVGLALILFAVIGLGLLTSLATVGLGNTLLFGIPVAILVLALAIGAVMSGRPNRGLSAEEKRQPE